MVDAKGIYISAECIEDAHSKDGGDFAHHVAGLLDEGYVIEIESQMGPLTFTGKDEFLQWFDRK